MRAQARQKKQPGGAWVNKNSSFQSCGFTRPLPECSCIFFVIALRQACARDRHGYLPPDLTALVRDISGTSGHRQVLARFNLRERDWKGKNIIRATP